MWSSLILSKEKYIFEIYTHVVKSYHVEEMFFRFAPLIGGIEKIIPRKFWHNIISSQSSTQHSAFWGK
jgi:hypothetical protein